ncbi:MAG TPA: DMT family transporter [Candidatus Eisenbacteria bacterium]|nr:DMT family transporter [Candidatus Eisenbacteria bacterium]
MSGTASDATGFPVHPERTSRVAEGSLLLITVLWGTTFPLLRLTLERISPYDVIALRFTIAGVVLALIYGRRIARAGRIAIWDGLRTGLFMAAGYLTQAIGLTTTSTPRSAFLTAMAVVFVPFISFVVLRTGILAGEAAGVGLAFLGLVFFYSDAGFGIRPGDLWTLAGAAAFGAQIVTTNVAARRSDPFVVSAVQAVVAAAVGWLFVGAQGGLSVPAHAVPWGTILYLSIVATAFILVLQTWALGKTKPVRAGVIYSLEPVFAAVFAMAFFAEGMSAREVLGSAAILAGVVVAELKKARWPGEDAADTRRTGGSAR